MDISARATSLADRPHWAIRVTSARTRREDRSSISSNPLADLGGLEASGYIIASSSRSRRSSRLGIGLVGHPRLETPATGKNAPGDAGQLVGKRDREDVVVQPLLGGLEPGLEPVALPALGLDQHNPRRLDEQGPQVAIATLRYLAEDRAIPVEICLGTSPSQAAKARPLANASPAPMAATIALEMIGPIPGTLISRSQPASRPTSPRCAHRAGASHQPGPR